MKNKHRIKQGLLLLLTGGIALTNLGAALPAFAEDAAATPETAQTATLDPDAAVLYADLPDAPAGSYIGSEGLPVATGQTKIGLSLWADGQLEQDSHLDPDALNSGDKTVTVPLTEDTDYAIVPLMAQVEYPADGSRTDVLLPENVTLLDYYGEPAQDTTVLHSEYAETSAAATGLYLLTDEDFTAQLVYTAPDGNSLTKNLNVVIDRSSTAAPPFADMGVAPYAGRPTPSVTSGRITKVAKINATWLIWFNGEPAYCCTHGANGQPNGCPPYSYSHTSTVGADQCIPGDHYGNQIRIWGGLNQLSLDEDGDFPAVFCAEDEAELSVSDFCEMIYDDLQLYIMQHYPDSRAAALYRESAEELLNGVQTYTAEAGYYTYIYQPAASGWQTVALIGPAIEGEEPEPEPEPVPQEYYADWQAPAQTAGGSFDLTFTVNTDKYQLNTLEKVDGAVITVTPSRTGGSVDGGSWQMSPAAAQTITTSGHTQDDSFHLNGGDGSATWTVHYEVSKTSTSTLSGQEGPFASQAEADAAAEAAKNAAIGQLQNEAQGMVDAAIASARAQLANITFSYDEITIPHGFDSTPGAQGSHQTITVPANSSNDYPMKNDEWSVKVSIDKIDSETKQRIKGDAEFKIFEWDVVRQCYIPTGGYNQYKVERQSGGTYKVINHSDYAGGSDDLFYTQRNEGKFVIVESRAPSGYYGDWTDVKAPGAAGSVLGKRAYAFEITKELDGQTIWLGNADYNADITTANSGGTLIDTGEGVVTITFGSRKADKTYATDPMGIANNEDSYIMHANADKVQNDRVLGNILLTKVDLDAARYLAAGSNGDTTLEGAVYDLYAADTIEHPDGVSGVVDYSKIIDANGAPIWHTTVLTNGGWDTDYLPILQKDRLVASAKITDGKLAFANLYMGRYYLVERATGLVLPIDGNGKLYVHRTNNGKRISQYTCSQYSKVPVGKLCTTQHRINEDVVLSLVSEMLKAIAEYAKHDRAEFVRVVQEAQSSQQTAEVRKQRTRLATAKQRVSELEVLLCKIYEDNILGKLSDSRYATLDAQYEKEQSELTAEISALEKAVRSYEKHEKDADRFIDLIDKYENFDKLTIAMLNEFIEKILVHERDRKGSIQTTQEVEIYFNFVGRFVPPAFGEVELTPEELEEIRKREERKDRLHQNYLKRKASGAQKRYEDKIKGRKKAEIEAKKAAIRAEDIAKGVFVPVSSLPQREPMKGVQTA